MSELLQDREKWFNLELQRKDKEIEQIKKWLEERTEDFKYLSRQKDNLQKYYDLLKSACNNEQKKNVILSEKIAKNNKKIKELEKKCKILEIQKSEKATIAENEKLLQILSEIEQILFKIWQFYFKDADLDNYREMAKLAKQGLDFIKEKTK